MRQIIPTRVISLYCPLFIMLYNLAGNLSNDIYLPSLPALSNYFHVSDFLVQITMTVWFLGVAIPQLIFGILADKYGRRPLMLWGGVLFLLSTLVCILAPCISILIIGRFFQGVGVSSLNIAAFATVKSHYYDEKASLKLLSYINITGSLAPIMGPILGGYIYYFLDWRATFIAIFILSGSAVIGLYYFMLESYDENNRNNLHFNIKNFLIYYKPILSQSNIWAPILSQSAFVGALIAYLTTAPFIIKDIYLIPIRHFGLTQVIPFSFFILGGVIVTKLINFMQPKKIIIVSFIMISLSLFLFDTILWLFTASQIYIFLFAISIFLFGFALAASPLVSEAMSLTSLKGLSAAILSLMMAIMASLSSLLTATFFNDKVYHTLIIMNIFSLGGMTCYICLKIRKKHAASLENN